MNNPLMRNALNMFYNRYHRKKTYMERYFNTFVVLMAISLIAQAYSGWSEFKFFHHNIVGESAPYSFQIALVLNIAFEFLKSALVTAFAVELLRVDGSFNPLFLAAGLACMVGSVYMSINGVDVRSYEAVEKPVDNRTAQTDKSYQGLIASIEKQIADIKEQYTYQGEYYLPYPNGNAYHTKAQVRRDYKLLEGLGNDLTRARNEFLEAKNSDKAWWDDTVASYEKELQSKMTKNRYTVIFSEALYMLCMAFGFWFGANAINDWIAQYGSPDGGDGQPGKQPKPQWPWQRKGKKIKGHEVPLDDYQKNRNKLEVSHRNDVSVTETGGGPFMEERTCEADGCGQTFEVDLRKEVAANPRKYCAKNCKEAMSRKLQEARRKEKRITDEGISNDGVRPYMFDNDEYGTS